MVERVPDIILNFYLFIYFWWCVSKPLQITEAMKLKMLTPWKESYHNLDNILKSRNISFPTKVYLVKAMVFPVVMYGCVFWTIKKAENQKLILLKCDVRGDS